MKTAHEGAQELLKNPEFQQKLSELGLDLNTWSGLAQRLGQFSPDHLQAAHGFRDALLRLGIDYATDTEALQQHFHGDLTGVLDYAMNVDPLVKDLNTAGFYEAVKDLGTDPEVDLVLGVQHMVEMAITHGRKIRRLKR